MFSSNLVYARGLYVSNNSLCLLIILFSVVISDIYIYLSIYLSRGGATLHFDVEVVSINAAPEQPNFFKQIDTDADGKISPEEVGAYFTAQGQTMPDELFGKEDTNGDGHISWDEFSGPKGTNPLGDEL